jgi:hypothetical protein
MGREGGGLMGVIKRNQKKVGNYNMHECDFKSLECVFNTHKSDFYCNFHAQSVISTHASVILILTSVITALSSGIYTRRV